MFRTSVHHILSFFAGMERFFVRECILILVLGFLPGSTLFGQVDPAAYPAGLRSEIERTGNDSLKIEKLFDLAFFYFDYEGEDHRSDSLGQIAITHGISRATVHRVIHEQMPANDGVQKGI